MADVNVWASGLAAGMFSLLMAGCVVDATIGGATGAFDRTLSVSGPVDLSVRTGSGSIRIQTGPAKVVRVVGSIQAHGLLWIGVDAVDEVKRLEGSPPIEQRGDVLRIGDGPQAALPGIAISYVLTVPVDTRVQSRSGSGHQEIGAVRGPVEASAWSGSLWIDHVGDHVRASTGSGAIEALGADGGLDARAGSGSISAQAISGTIYARTGSGRIEIAQVTPGPIDVAAGSGTVTLRLPEEAAFELDARTGSGSIQSHRPIAVAGILSRRHLHGTVGGGGRLVKVSTGSGRIRID
jgi:hypothetical protein